MLASAGIASRSRSLSRWRKRQMIPASRSSTRSPTSATSPRTRRNHRASSPPRARRRRPLWAAAPERQVGDPKADAGAAEEDDLAQHWRQSPRRQLKHVQAHAATRAAESRLRSMSAANPLTRASPMRTASISASCSARDRFERAIRVALACSGSSATPFTSPIGSGHTGGSSSDGAEDVVLSGGAAHAVGMPRVSPPRTDRGTVLKRRAEEELLSAAHVDPALVLVEQSGLNEAPDPSDGSHCAGSRCLPRERATSMAADPAPV